MKRKIGLGSELASGCLLAAVALCGGALQADTLTWTATANGKWSTAPWSSDGSHTVPQSGDTIVINATAAKLELENDIEGLSTPHFEFKAPSSSAHNFTLRGKAITLTGGWNAVKSTSGYTRCFIPFVLTVQDGNPTNRFWCAGGRIEQYGKVSGAGMLVKDGASIMGIRGGNTYTGGTALIDNSGGWLDVWAWNSSSDGTENSGSTPLGDVSKPYDIVGTGLSRLTLTPFPYNVRIHPPANKANNSDEFWVYYQTRQFSGNVTGTRFVVDLDQSCAADFSGDITVDGPVRFPVTKSLTVRRSCTFSGHISCTAFNDTMYVPSQIPPSVDMTFSHADNDIGAFYANVWNHHAAAVNAFGTNAVVYMGARLAGYGTLDLGGYDQRIDRFAEDTRYSAAGTAADFAGRVVTSAGGAARLTMAATADSTADVLFDGALTLVWEPQGGYTFRTAPRVGRAMGMSGGIVVSNGTFEVNGTNSFPNASSIEVADGAAFEWKSACAGKGLLNLTRLAVGAGATFSVADGATQPIPEDDATSILAIDLAGTARLVLRDGDTLAACAVSTNGVALNPFTTYTGDPNAADATYLPQLAGSTARLKVFGPTSSGTDARTWTAGASGTSMALADNWSGEGSPNLSDGTLVPTFAQAGTAATFGDYAFMKNVVFSGDRDFTVSSTMDGRIYLFGGVTTAARSGALYTIDAPVTVMDGQTWNVAANTTLKLAGGLAAPVTGAPFLIAKDGEGTLDLRGDSRLASNIDVTNGYVDVYGDIAGTGDILLYQKGAVLRMHGADIEKRVIVRARNEAQNNATVGNAIQAMANTTNRLVGGIESLQVSGTPQITVKLEGNSQLTVEREFQKSGAYWTVSGDGDFIVTNCPSFRVGCLQMNTKARVHLRQPCFESGIPNYITIGAGTTLSSEAYGAINRAPLQLQGCLDLCGIDQTMGRMSWVSKTNATSVTDLQVNAEIRSDEPATLTVRHDNTSGSGSNRGMQIYAGKITGRVSLVKTGGTQNGNTTPDAQDLFLANAMTSTGEVSVVWGLLSFTNNVVYGGKTYCGSWTNCTAARAEATVDGLGNARAGVLELCHSGALGRDTDVFVSGGGKVRLLSGVRQKVRYLYLPTGENGVYERQPTGTYGSSSADGASHKLDAYFEGNGVLYCVGVYEGAVIVIR